MGRLENGVWQDVWYDTAETGGQFVRDPARFRDRVTADGSSGFPAAPGRYRLIVSYACPWAHRTLIYRAVKRLDDVIPITVVDPVMAEKGWVLPDGTPLYEFYRSDVPDYSGRVTVPVLWDEETKGIVNNESAEIIRMLDRAWDAWGDASLHFCPDELRPAIDEVNEFVYSRINNGVYRAGFATTQAAYEEAFDTLFAGLDDLDERLSRQRYLLGERITEADWRLFTTLVRFDVVYFGHFKCNKRRIADYPNLWPYVRELFQVPGVAGTVHFDHIKRHYFGSHKTINPLGIIPKGPDVDFLQPHGRDMIGTWEESGC